MLRLNRQNVTIPDNQWIQNGLPMGNHKNNWSWSDQKWLLAVMDADTSGDLGPLVARLSSRESLSHRARELIADLLKRHQLKKRPGGRSRPIYQSPSDVQVKVIAAALAYREEGRRKGESRDDAIERLARDYGCDGRQLRNFLKQAGGIARRYGRVFQP